MRLLRIYVNRAIILSSLLALSLACKVEKNTEISIHEKSELGRYLFFDKGLSFNARISCSSCHDPGMAFTDGYRKAINDKADQLATNTTTVLNLKDYPYLSWTDTTVVDLQKQLKRPLFSEKPIELGLHFDSLKIFDYLSDQYSSGFVSFYDDISSESVIDALASYINSLECRNAVVDDFVQGKDCEKVDVAFYEGWNCYFELDCHSCHGGRDFNIPELSSNYPNSEFRIPGLRNVRITKPYFHDGSVFDLSEAITIHSESLYADQSISRIPTDADIQKLLHFLDELTDTSYLSNEHFTSPFNQ